MESCSSTTGFRFGFLPQRRKIPIFVGAHNPKMLEFAGKYADGVLLNTITKEEVSYFLEHIEEGAKSAGRSLSDIEIASFFNCCAAEDRKTRLDELKRRMAWFLVMPHVLNRMKRTPFKAEAEKAEEILNSGKPERITDAASDELIDSMCISDAPSKIMEHVEEFRALGITLPILFPTPVGGDLEEGYEKTLDIL